MSIIKAKFDESACIINRLRLKWNGEVQQMNLAKRMAYLKKRDGLTTEMLSQRSGVAAGTLNKLLNGATRRPALETMERVARAFGVPVRYFTDAAVLGTEFEVGAYVEEQGMFAISARERDMLEMLRELSAYECDFFTKHWRQCMRCARSIGKAARRGSCSAICRLFRWTALCPLGR